MLTQLEMQAGGMDSTVQASIRPTKAAKYTYDVPVAWPETPREFYLIWLLFDPRSSCSSFRETFYYFAESIKT